MDFSRILSHSTKQPKSILRIVISIGVALLVMWMFMVSRMEITPSPKKVIVNDSTQTESITESLLRKKQLADAEIAETDSATTATPVETVTSAKEEGGIFQNAATTFVVLVGLMGGVLYFISRKNKKKPLAGKDDVVELGGHVIGQRAQLKFLEINNEVWVIGLTPGDMKLMQRIPKEFWNAHQIEEEETDDDSSFDDFMKPYYKNFKN